MCIRICVCHVVGLYVRPAMYATYIRTCIQAISPLPCLHACIGRTSACACRPWCAPKAAGKQNHVAHARRLGWPGPVPVPQPPAAKHAGQAVAACLCHSLPPPPPPRRDPGMVLMARHAPERPPHPPPHPTHTPHPNRVSSPHCTQEPSMPLRALWLGLLASSSPTNQPPDEP